MESSNQPHHWPYTSELDPNVQTELSPHDALAVIMVTSGGDLVRDADDAAAISESRILISEGDRENWTDVLSRLADPKSLVIAWSGDDGPLLCPRAALALCRFRLGLESLGCDQRGFAAYVHDNLGNPSLHGLSWAMVLTGAPVPTVRELMERTWREAAEAVRPHNCSWCRSDS